MKPHEPVGLLIDRSPEMIFGVLAIVKAGGGYVPIDPEYPDARIDYMLRDTGIQLLLTKNEWLKQVSISQTELICLDQGYEEFLSEAELKSAALKPDGLAYINYTSGSTGQPKGVLIPHQAVIRLVCVKQIMSPLMNKRVFCKSRAFPLMPLRMKYGEPCSTAEG
ncbi:hypothetical protein BsIDN1_06920 [Bacillus safensis]|uniref:AMP-dependent synthetase/ligase domain-containing protein n=1 Tax=Bacillus safensis TaxID=561879 RepID=A0A5S9M4I3_BACIA|nr:hypothetical protein BsIDN1_06920 [Bacillus safensis]